MKIYIAEVNECIFESAYRPISIHQTKLGSWKAMHKHKVDSFNNWFDIRTNYGKEKGDKFGWDMDWAIKETNLFK